MLRVHQVGVREIAGHRRHLHALGSHARLDGATDEWARRAAFFELGLQLRREVVAERLAETGARGVVNLAVHHLFQQQAVGLDRRLQRLALGLHRFFVALERGSLVPLHRASAQALLAQQPILRRRQRRALLRFLRRAFLGSGNEAGLAIAHALHAPVQLLLTPLILGRGRTHLARERSARLLAGLLRAAVLATAHQAVLGELEIGLLAVAALVFLALELSLLEFLLDDPLAAPGLLGLKLGARCAIAHRFLALELAVLLAVLLFRHQTSAALQQFLRCGSGDVGFAQESFFAFLRQRCAAGSGFDLST